MAPGTAPGLRSGAVPGDRARSPGYGPLERPVTPAAPPRPPNELRFAREMCAVRSECGPAGAPATAPRGLYHVLPLLQAHLGAPGASSYECPVGDRLPAIGMAAGGERPGVGGCTGPGGA